MTRTEQINAKLAELDRLAGRRHRKAEERSAAKQLKHSKRKLRMAGNLGDYLDGPAHKARIVSQFLGMCRANPELRALVIKEISPLAIEDKS